MSLTPEPPGSLRVHFSMLEGSTGRGAAHREGDVLDFSARRPRAGTDRLRMYRGSPGRQHEQLAVSTSERVNQRQLFWPVDDDEVGRLVDGEMCV